MCAGHRSACTSRDGRLSKRHLLVPLKIAMECQMRRMNWVPCFLIMFFGAGAALAAAQVTPPVEGQYMGQGTTTTDRTDVAGNLPRADTTIVGPMDAPPAGTVRLPCPPLTSTGTTNGDSRAADAARTPCLMNRVEPDDRTAWPNSY